MTMTMTMTSSSSQTQETQLPPLERKRKKIESGDTQKEIDQKLETGKQKVEKKNKKKKEKPVKQDNEQSISSSTHSEDQDISQVEVEAISHKEKRKRRKLEKKMTTTSTDDNNPEGESKKEKETKGKITSSKTIETIFTTNTRSKYSIWVGNLLFTTTAQELARFFESCGKITRLNMPNSKRENENNKGFAYVDFETESGVDNAIDKSESPLGGRKLLIKRASDYTGRPEISSITLPSSINNISTTLMKSARKILDSQKQPPAPCLYFGNLGFETTSESIAAMLHAHHEAQQVWKPKASQPDLQSNTKSKKPELEEEKEGEESCADTEKDVASTPIGIRKVRMGTFEDSGKCKGFAFVDFESVAQATNALLNLKNHKLDGRNLQVEYASADAVKRGGGSVKSIQFKKPMKSSNTDTNNFDQQKSNQHHQSNQRPTHFKNSQHQTGTHNTIKTKLDSSSEILPPPPSSAAINHYLPPKNEKFSTYPQEFTPKNYDDAKSKKKEFKGRQKPGAVLANARRAPVGIVKFPDQSGKKTLFT